jgi:hypothetical protein
MHDRYNMHYAIFKVSKKEKPNFYEFLDAKTQPPSSHIPNFYNTKN